MAIRVAINGFGRIGRCVFRAAWKDSDIEFVHINDLTDVATLAHLLEFDSVHGRMDADIRHEDGAIIVDGKRIVVSAERDPASLPWAANNVDVVLECTGVFRKRAGATKHLDAGAKRVLISAPAVDPDATRVFASPAVRLQSLGAVGLPG